MRLGRSMRWTAAVAIVVAGVLLIPQAAMAATVTNGSFETGDFAGWTTQAQGADPAGSWLVYTGTTLPESEITLPAPSCGTHAAVTYQGDPSSNVLYQDLTLEPGETHTLTFTHYYQNAATENDSDTPLFASPATLDYSIDGANQQYRVDIMKTTADPFSVASADILQTVFQTEPGDPATLAPTPVTVDLSAYAGQTVRLRFAVAVNDDELNAGVDCVTLTSAPITTSSTTTTTALATTSTTAAPVAKAVATTPAFTG